MLAGDGEGLVDAADVGLLDGAGIVQYSGTYDTPEKLRAALSDDTVLVLTDSNRRQARRWTSVRDNLGVTEQPGETPISDDPSDARLDVFPADDDAARSTMDQRGVEWATATSYGNTITYTPEDAAARAFDGDVETAWRGGAFGAGIGQKIRVVLDDPITTGRINLVQPHSTRAIATSRRSRSVRRRRTRSTPISTARRARRPVRRCPSTPGRSRSWRSR